MGKTLCYIAEASDPATPVVDLNGLAWGEPYGFQLIDVAWGGIDSDATFAESPPTPAGELLVRHHPIVEGTLVLFADFNAADYRVQRDTFRLLGQMLDTQAVIVWQPDVADALAVPIEAVYIDTFPSPVAAMFRGQTKGGLKLVDMLLDPDGYPVRVRHHPYARSADEQIAASVSVDNAVGGGVLTVTNPGTALSEARLSIAVPDAGAKVSQAIVGRRSRGNLAEYASSLTGFAISGATSVTSYWRKLWEHTLSPTDGTALDGTFRVLATLTLNSADIYHLQLRSSWTTDEPLGAVPDDLILDAEDLQTFHETEVDLGLVHFDRNAPALVIQCWGRREGSGSITWGQVTLVPADESYLVLSSPGQRGGRYARETWDGDELDLSPTNLEVTDDGQVILTANGNAATTPPSGGTTLPVGRYVARFNGFVRNRDRTKAKIGELQVLENGSLLRRASLYSKRGMFQTRYGPDERRQVQWDAQAGATYNVRVEYTAATVVGRTIHTNRLRRWNIPTLQSGRQIVVDSGRRASYLANANGTRFAPAKATGLLYLEPGDNALVIRLGDVAAAGYDSVDDRERLVRIFARQGEVTVDVSPRHLIP